jgi:hypothetical protein
MAPEQARATRDLTPAVDVFSLGAVLAFAATGAPPFGEGSGADLFYRIVHQEPDLEPVHALDPALAALIGTCLGKDPRERPSAGELADAAADRTTPGPPDWPATVADLVTARRAFAGAPIPPLPEADVGETGLETRPETDPQAAAGSRIAAILTVEPVVPVSLGDGVDPAASAEAETVAVANGEKPPAAPKERRSRKKTLALILPLILLCGTAGTLIGLHDMPFISDADPGGGGEHALADGATGTGGPTFSASPAATHTATSPAAAGHSASAAPKSSKGAAAGGSQAAGSGSNGSDTGGSGTAGSGTGSSGSGSGASGGSSGGSGNSAGGGTQTSAPPATKTTNPGSGGGVTVVSTSYGLLKSAAAGSCATDEGDGVEVSFDSCDGGNSQQGWRQVSVSGGIEVVNQSSGFCLTNPNGGIVSLFDCGEGSSQVWTIGTDTSSGGTLENDGACMYYTSLNGGMVEMATCDASDSGQLWYDGGSA